MIGCSECVADMVAYFEDLEAMVGCWKSWDVRKWDVSERKKCEGK